MWEYIKIRDELGDADIEVRELTRLLEEAKARRDNLISIAPVYTWTEWILQWFGFQIKSN
tara:strand:- start:221 stop:400 length:180 start_codon:yes stop_codon:yes gene_type:complete